MKIVVYTDGACKGNPGSGGWAYVCLFNGKPHMIASGHKDDTTNNCMELTAIYKALNYIKKYNGVYHFNIEYFFICSDSAYCINAINQNWIENWKRNGWKTNKNIEIKNKDIWEKVYNLLKEFGNVKFVKVKAHNGVNGMRLQTRKQVKLQYMVLESIYFSKLEGL